ncbi:MAG: hypothetical protein ACRC5T_04655 [Cetobacterium sp.]
MILLISVFGMGLKAVFFSFIVVQTPFSIVLYCILTKEIPEVYYEVCSEIGEQPFKTFIWPLYKGKIKKILLINFIMLYNEYFISKTMSLSENLIQNELVISYSKILFEGYNNFLLLLVMSIIPPLFAIKSLYQEDL